MFIKKDDLVEISIYFKQAGFKYLALTESEVEARIKKKKLTEDQLDKDFKKLVVKMAVLSWGSYNQFQENSSKLTPKGEKYFDYKTYKEERLRNLVRSWDAVDEENKEVPVSEQTIMALAPTIGDAMVRGYDEASFYDEESEKK